MAPQTLKVPPQSPVSFNASPRSLIEEAQSLIAETKALWDRVIATVTPETANIANTILPIAHQENKFGSVAKFYASTSPSKELREASSTATKLFSDFEVEQFLRRDMFVLVAAVVDKTSQDALDPETFRFLTKLHAEFVHNGCGLPDGPLRSEFKDGSQRLRRLIKDVNQNLHEDKSGIWLTHQELDGLPRDFILSLSKGTAANDGKVWLTFKRPHLRAVLEQASNEDIRRKVYTADQNRMLVNAPLYQKIILLRDSLARTLGYESHAAFKTAQKCVENCATVLDFLAETRARITPLLHDEVREMLQLKMRQMCLTEDDPDAKLFYWDWSYYARLLDQSKATPDIAQISEYFEVWNTVRQLLSVYERLFRISIDFIKPEWRSDLCGVSADTMVWHGDVRPYMIWDEASGAFLGYLYFDLFPRVGKYSHRGHFSLDLSYEKPDGTRNFPSSVLVMNYPLPTAERPSLLALDDVRSLFHEIGHGLHNLFTVSKFSRLHKTVRDFCEVPSIAFEMFMYTRHHIKEVSCHYTYLFPEHLDSWIAAQETVAPVQPPRQLSDDLVDSWLGLKHKNDPHSVMTNLFLATYDMKVHHPASREELENMDFNFQFNSLRNEMLGLHGGESLGEGWDWAHGESSFRLIMAGYDAGYYAYTLDRAWALDIFESTFKNDTQSQDAGERFRRGILQLGGTESEMTILREFLGREPCFDAFYKWLGVPVRKAQE